VSAQGKYSNPEVLARIARLGLRARHAVTGTLAGLHHSPLLGASVEFADYREYAPGDDLRKLDWRVYARTGRYVVKQFEEETNLRATFMLDASASMAYGGERAAMGKYDYAATVVACLATLAVEQRDGAGMILFDTEARHRFRPSTTRLQLDALLSRIEATTPTRETALPEVVARAADELPRRGLVFLVSDFLTDLDELFGAFGRLRHRAHEIVLVHVLDPDELDLPFQGNIEFRDLEGAEVLQAEPRYFREAYQAAMAEFCTRVETRSKDFGSDYILARTDRDLGDLLAYYLHRRSRGRAGRGGLAARASSLRATGLGATGSGAAGGGPAR
jgi:uncharacterized protein (DUF58 family)